MIKTEKQDASAKGGTRLLIGNLPYSMDKSEFMAAFTRHADLTDVYLSSPKAPSRSNAGWGIIAVDEAAAQDILGLTVMVGNRVARITRARVQGE